MSKISSAWLYQEEYGTGLLDIAKRYLSTDIADEDHEIVFVFTDKNGYFSIFRTIQDFKEYQDDFLNFDGKNKRICFNPEDEELLCEYLAGNDAIVNAENEVVDGVSKVDKVQEVTEVVTISKDDSSAAENTLKVYKDLQNAILNASDRAPIISSLKRSDVISMPSASMF